MFDWLLRQDGVGPEWVRALGDLPGRPGQHITTQPLRLAAQTPAALAGAYPLGAGAALPPDARPQITEADQLDRDAWLARHGLADAPLVLFQPGNEKTMRRGLRRRASNTKGWHEQRRAQVLARVQQRLPVARLRLCGSPGERPLAEDIHRLCGGLRVSIATDELPIPRLLALQARAHSMVSIDTGPAHSAAAMGCPLVVLFAQRRARVLSVPLAGSAPVVTLGPAAEGDDDGTLSISADAVLGAWRQKMSLRLPGV